MRCCCCGKSKQDKYGDDKPKRVLGCPDLTLLSLSLIVGTVGIFVMPGLALKIAGPGAVRCMAVRFTKLKNIVTAFEFTEDVTFEICVYNISQAK